MRQLINICHVSWGNNSTPVGAAKFSTLLLVSKTGGDLGSYWNLTPKGRSDQIRSGYYPNASNKCSLKSQRAKEFEGLQWLVRCLWKAKPTSLFSVTMQANDDKTKMVSADSGCSSAPLFHGPQIGWTGGGMRLKEHTCVSVCMCMNVCVTSKWEKSKSGFIRMKKWRFWFDLPALFHLNIYSAIVEHPLSHQDGEIHSVYALSEPRWRYFTARRKE